MTGVAAQRPVWLPRRSKSRKRPKSRRLGFQAWLNVTFYRGRRGERIERKREPQEPARPNRRHAKRDIRNLWRGPYSYLEAGPYDVRLVVRPVIVPASAIESGAIARSRNRQHARYLRRRYG